MGAIFNVDNKFFQGISKLVDCVVLSTLWLMFSTPVITAGASTTALYYTVNKVLRNNRGYVWQEFWSAFKSNFKQSTLVWLLMLLLYAIMGIDMYIMYQFEKAGSEIGKLYVVFFLLMLVAAVWMSYLFPYIARFSDTIKQTLKNTLLMMIASLPWSFLLMILVLATVVVLDLFLPAVFVVPAFSMMIANLILERVFKKYMSPEDLAAEEERNREYFN